MYQAMVEKRIRNQLPDEAMANNANGDKGRVDLKVLFEFRSIGTEQDLHQENCRARQHYAANPALERR
jgi:hypothetical protein